MKKLKIYPLLLTGLLLFSQCSDNLSDLNIDPNSAVKVAPYTLVTSAQYEIYNELHDTRVNANWGQLMVQYWAQNQYADDSRYNQEIVTFNYTFSSIYANVLKELAAAKDIINNEKLPEEISTNQINIIDVIATQAYCFLTDGFNDVPYSEAIGSKAQPKYDSQEEIYKGVLATLENAAKTFSPSNPSFTSGDIIYNGDIGLWIKFTNSLMLRYAMRISDIDAATAEKYVKIAASNLISSNAENALFTFQSSLLRANPLFQNNSPLDGNRDDYCVSEFLVNTLNDLGDPRLEKFAKPTSTGSILGMPYGLTDKDALILNPTTSRPNDNVRAATTPHVIISYAEVQFLLAEAYQRGFLSGNATAAYKAGITASMNYWGINEATAIDTYIANNPYNQANWKASIGVQKWIAFYMNGFEAWNEWRRLDYPKLKVPDAAIIKSIPVRMPYPLSETQTNSLELSKVTTTPEKLTTKVWWDVN